MRKWLPLAAACLGSFMFLVDTTVVTVALPGMARDLPASLESLQWVANVYTLVLAVLMLTAGSIADIYGHRDTYVGGLIAFGAASLLCGLAPDAATLIAARALQGIGGAALAVTTFALVAGSYDGKDRGTAMGVFFAVTGLAAAVGPMLGGVLTAGFGWRAIFFVNLPIVAFTVVLALRSLTNVRRGQSGARLGKDGARLDPFGMITFAVAAGALTYALTAGERGWYFVAAAGLVAFVAVERRRGGGGGPLLDLRLFARPAFSTVMLCAMAGSVSFACLVYTSIHLQSGEGLGPVRAGLAMTPLALASFLTSTVAGRFLHGASPRFTVGIGLLAGGLGCALQAWSLTPGLVVTGIGVGIAGPSMGAAVMASAPKERGGMAAGAMTTFRQLGQTLGVAVLGVVYQSESGLDGVYLTAGAIGLVTGGLAVAVIRRAPAPGVA
ncbi:MFS transporter [Actinomadura barringtoniae]|uniref:MFS transporter n=1 Tax=Actinomadura barringtoniae TaxID=1427535 RepID=A0A939PFQ6_9ACTN|nr:MFS transporter [Actinomadura barringtoniae]MBO2451397.1 MFS transporter [Actinomadura barringtoniae]